MRSLNGPVGMDLPSDAKGAARCGSQRVHARGSGYTRAQVQAALQSIAESIGCTLRVLPLPAAATGELWLLRVAMELDTL